MVCVDLEDKWTCRQAWSSCAQGDSQPATLDAPAPHYTTWVLGVIAQLRHKWRNGGDTIILSPYMRVNETVKRLRVPYLPGCLREKASEPVPVARTQRARVGNVENEPDPIVPGDRTMGHQGTRVDF